MSISPYTILYFFKFVNEVNLAFPCYLRGFADTGVAICMSYDSLLDLKQPQVHTVLGRHVIIGAFSLDQITVISQPLKEPVLASIYPVLSHYLGQLPDQDRCPGCTDCISKDNLWLLLFQLPFSLDSFLLFLFQGRGQLDDRVRIE